MNSDEFRTLLRDKTVQEIVDTHIVSDNPGPFVTRASLRLLENEARRVFRLRDDQSLSTIVVGSAKLGFAMLKKRRTSQMPERPAYRVYDPDTSDIDVAVVSSALYTSIWRDLARTGANQPAFPWSISLAPYMLNGWIRPDKFPPQMPQRCTDWTSLIQRVGRMEPFRYKRLRCGLFHSDHFLDLYQQRGVSLAQREELGQ